MCNGNSSRAQNTKRHPNFHSEVVHAKMTALRSPASHLIGLNTSNRKEKIELRFGRQSEHVYQISRNSERVGFSLLVDLDVE